MKDKNLLYLKEKYEETPIPNELDFLVRKAIKDGGKSKMEKKNFWKRAGAVAATVALVAAGLTAGINTSPAFANTMAKVPGMDSIVKVLTFKEFIVDEGNYYSKIEIPNVQGLENKELEKILNEKYIAEGKALYAGFMQEIEELKENGGHLGVDSGYTIKTDTDRILSIERYFVNTVASSSTKLKYDTIDKKNQILINLPSLFKDERYMEIISKNIKSQMVEKMKKDEGVIYWIAQEDEELFVEEFEAISSEQNFYINADHKLVIVFDKYEVAPGYMGNPEFEIPTEVLVDVLVSNEYLK